MIHETYRNDEDHYILVFIVYRDTSERRMNEKYSFAHTTFHSRSWYIYDCTIADVDLGNITTIHEALWNRKSF